MPPSAVAGGSWPQTASTSSPREITRFARVARMPSTACCRGCPTRSSSWPFQAVPGPSTATRSTTLGWPSARDVPPPTRAEASISRLAQVRPFIQKKYRSRPDAPRTMTPASPPGLRDPESPALTPPPSLPVVRAGTRGPAYGGGMRDVTVTGLHKAFGTHQVLTGVDLEVPTGSLTAILGPSGSGKTTLLRLLAGFERADAGSIRVGARLGAG